MAKVQANGKLQAVAVLLRFWSCIGFPITFIFKANLSFRFASIYFRHWQDDVSMAERLSKETRGSLKKLESRDEMQVHIKRNWQVVG